MTYIRHVLSGDISIEIQGCGDATLCTGPVAALRIPLMIFYINVLKR